MSPMTFVVLSPAYDENNGGAIVLHKLCHEINRLGRKAYLFPFFPGAQFDTEDPVEYQRRLDLTQQHMGAFVINPAIRSDVIGPENIAAISQRDDIVAVYPEIIAGNPLRARNVARWLLHDAGFHTGKVYFSPGEIYYRFDIDTKMVQIPGSRTSTNLLTVNQIPFELYNREGVAAVRSGTAYCVRKGRGKAAQHDLNNSIPIDGLPHAQVAEIFKRVERFISYDTRTLYSRLAALCGCDSIVIPDEGLSEDQWMPDPAARHGVAYGFENLEKARQTAHLTVDILRAAVDNSNKTVRVFIDEVENYFATLTRRP